jgi:hypothetical protein
MHGNTVKQTETVVRPYQWLCSEKQMDFPNWRTGIRESMTSEGLYDSSGENKLTRGSSAWPSDIYIDSTFGLAKAKSLHAMKALGGRGGIAPTHSRPQH